MINYIAKIYRNKKLIDKLVKLYDKKHKGATLFFCLKDFLSGLYYKYPLCCILVFVYETYKHILSAQNREDIYGKRIWELWKPLRYVPCHRCCRKLILKSLKEKK